MALSWSMDKLGPLCRTAEDCALVLDAIRGPDGRDASVREAPFSFDPQLDVRTLRAGYLRKAFEEPFIPAQGEKPAQHEWKDFDDAALGALDRMGVKLQAVDLPDIPWLALRPILVAEAAAAFDELTRSGRDRELVQQGKDNWPNIFRAARFISAVDFIQADRLRRRVVDAFTDLFRPFDAMIGPSFGNPMLLATNFTGHPCLVVRAGFVHSGARDLRNRPAQGDAVEVPHGVSLWAKPYDESVLVRLGSALESRLGATDRRLDGF